MIDRAEATRLISQWLESKSTQPHSDPIELCLCDEETIEADFGWIFFYTSKVFEQIGDPAYAIGGNAPVIVDRTVGSMHVTGTALPTKSYVAEFLQMRSLIGLATASYVGEPLEHNYSSLLTKIPSDFREFLRWINGCIVFGGGLHVRGCVRSPSWHSLENAWLGPSRLSALYPAVEPDDIPFAQDCLGDQFLLRSTSVLRLNGETGELEDLRLGWREFFHAAAANPVEFLSLQLLEQFRSDGDELESGQLLSVHPPLCTKQAAEGVSLRAISAGDRLAFLADFAKQIAALEDGTQVRLEIR